MSATQHMIRSELKPSIFVDKITSKPCIELWQTTQNKCLLSGNGVINRNTIQCKKVSIHVNDNGTVNLLMALIDALSSTEIYPLVFVGLCNFTTILASEHEMSFCLNELKTIILNATFKLRLNFTFNII